MLITKNKALFLVFRVKMSNQRWLCCLSRHAYLAIHSDTLCNTRLAIPSFDNVVKSVSV